MEDTTWLLMVWNKLLIIIRYIHLYIYYIYTLNYCNIVFIYFWTVYARMRNESFTYKILKTKTKIKIFILDFFSRLHPHTTKHFYINFLKVILNTTQVWPIVNKLLILFHYVIKSIPVNWKNNKDTYTHTHTHTLISTEQG